MDYNTDNLDKGKALSEKGWKLQIAIAVYLRVLILSLILCYGVKPIRSCFFETHEYRKYEENYRKLKCNKDMKKKKQTKTNRLLLITKFDCLLIYINNKLTTYVELIRTSN